MLFYNQLDYGNVPYDKKSTKEVEYIAKSGCGVCSLLNVVNNMAGKRLYTVEEMAKFSVANGARDDSGTNMVTLLKAFCKENPDFSYRTTSKNADLVSHLQKGGMAIVNQGDVYNVFSSAGHYVAAVGVQNTDDIIIYDSYMYQGKYATDVRKSRIIKATDTGCIVDIKQVGKATIDRDPSYYLITFSGKKSSPKEALCKYIKSNATMVKGTDVYHDNKKIKKTGYVDKNERVRVLVKGTTWAIIQYSVTADQYAAGLVPVASVKED